MKLSIRSSATDGFQRVEVHRVYDATQARLISQAVTDAQSPPPEDWPNTCLQEDYRVLNMAAFMARQKVRMHKMRRITQRWKARQKVKRGKLVRLRART